MRRGLRDLVYRSAFLYSIAGNSRDPRPYLPSCLTALFYSRARVQRLSTCFHSIPLLVHRRVASQCSRMSTETYFALTYSSAVIRRFPLARFTFKSRVLLATRMLVPVKQSREISLRHRWTAINYIVAPEVRYFIFRQLTALDLFLYTFLYPRRDDDDIVILPNLKYAIKVHVANLRKREDV